MNRANWLRVVLPALLLAAIGSFPVSQDLTVSAQQAVAPCTHFVSMRGDNSHAGTAGGPWATLQHAANRAGPGDVVCVEDGVYGGENGPRFARSGEAEAPIIFQALPADDPPGCK